MTSLPLETSTNHPDRLGFLSLPPEIRRQVYYLSLVSSEDFYVPHFLFQRRRSPYIISPEFVLSLQDKRLGRRGRLGRSTLAHDLPDHPLRALKFPSLAPPNNRTGPTEKHNVSIGLIRTCHGIYSEAAPVLYGANALQFENARAAQAFRWACPNAVFVTNVHIILGPLYNDHDNTRNRTNDRSWIEYLESGWHDLQSDFPRLKHVTLTLGREYETASLPRLRAAIRPFRKHLHLKSFETLGLCHEDSLTEVEDIVRPSDSRSAGPENSGKGVQRYMSEYDELPGWKNALLWWGRDGEPPPVDQKSLQMRWRRRYRRRLYRVDMDENSVALMVGESYDLSSYGSHRELGNQSMVG